VERGFYEVRRFGDTGTPPRVVAVNVDVAESEMARIDPAAIVRGVTARAGAATAASLAAPPTAEQQEARQTLWWYLLAGALVLLGAETLLSNRYGRNSGLGARDQGAAAGGHVRRR